MSHAPAKASTIVHISDLHFGRVDPIVADSLLEDIIGIAPTLVTVSGDLTQRARRSQFAAARAYLERIPFPKLVVPGNHDIPLYPLWHRLLRPHHRYRRHITPDLSPYFRNEGLAVLGVDSTCSYRWKRGCIRRRQVGQILARLCPPEEEVFKVLVTHHPFVLPGEDGKAVLVKPEGALRAMEACGVDLLLAGHLHKAYTGDVLSRFPGLRRSVLAVQAGTAISTRTHRGSNAYNVIHIRPRSGRRCLGIQVRPILPLHPSG